jgi:hypothetical protein
MTYIKQVATKIILLLSLALDETYAVFEISFATMPHATGWDIFHPNAGSSRINLQWEKYYLFLSNNIFNNTVTISKNV